MSAKFTDGKDEGALRTIGEVSTALGIKTHVLRYWEQQFPSLQPLKRSGRRYYRSEDISLVETIDQLVNRDGYTLKGAQQALKDGKVADTQAAGGAVGGAAGRAVPHVAAELAPELVATQPPAKQHDQIPAEVIAQIKAIRAKLAAAIA